MHIAEDKEYIYCDIDNTLMEPMFLASPGESTAEELTLEWYGTIKVLPNYELIDTLKLYKQAGYGIVVWHGGSVEYAKKVLELLKLQDVVDCVVPKPTIYYDDDKPEFILGKKGEY